MSKFTRRDFTRLSALTIAAGLTPALRGQSAPPAPSANPDRKIGYAVVGLGVIAGHFLPGALLTTNSRITALVSGHREKAERIAAQYDVPTNSIYNYENFDEIAHNPAIDAVYVALPNSIHAEYTIRAAKAGKHVMCEKPMATTVADCEAMIAACKAANVKLMIAYRCHFEPTHLKAIQIIRDGSLGKIQAIESAFGFNISPAQWRLSKKFAGGGPLMDVGIYCLNATRYLTGEEPEHIAAFASTIDRDGRFAEVEESVSWTMRFPSGILATCNTTYGSEMLGYVRVYGSKGFLHMDPAFNYDGVRLHAEWPGTKLLEVNPSLDPYQFIAEAAHFSRDIQTNQEPRANGPEGLRDIQYITQIYKSARH